MNNSENRFTETAKRGFTLIEILVAVSIIGILAAIGTTSVAGYIDKSRKIAAQEGVKTIHNAVVTYMMDMKKAKPPTDLKVLIEDRGEEQSFMEGGEGALVDPWDGDYKIESKGKKFWIVSAGPDGQFGTDDDIRSDKIEKTKK